MKPHRFIEYTYEKNPYVEQNSFIDACPNSNKLPNYEEICSLLPKPIFEGHDDYIACYDYAWKTAFSNLRNVVDGSGFISDFIDTAFNGCIFMWDSSFILMFTKYADRIFPFQKTLDNFYAGQHKDGFICREINEETGLDQFTRHDPSSTGPNIMPWCEWQYFENFNDLDRLKKVYAPLRAYHIWCRKNKTWRDGTYFTTGWGCGMDNSPRLKDGYDVEFSTGRMIWVDACLQALMSCDCLIKMNNALGNQDDVSDLIEEKNNLKKIINKRLWDKKTKFYYDLWDDGKFNKVKHAGAFWALHTDVATKRRAKALFNHLKNPKEFFRNTPVPTLSADHPAFDKDGGYWRGSAWAPTNYMILLGLEKHGQTELAKTIAEKYLATVVEVFNKDLTLYENYAPDQASKGNFAMSNFVGWTGLAPISIFFEFVLGIKAFAPENRIIWNVSRLEKHGIMQYPVGKTNTVDLICERRNNQCDEPIITIKAKEPIEIVVRWNGKEKIIKA